MNDDCFINEGCNRPKLSGKKHDPFLDIPVRPYINLQNNLLTSTTTSTTTTQTPYDQELLDLIVIPVSGKRCPITLSTTTSTTTTTTINPSYLAGGLKGKFNTSSDSISTISQGDVGINLPISNGIILTNINYQNAGDYYSFMAFGYFRPPVNGLYTFSTFSDDGSAIWLGVLANIENGRNETNALLNNNVAGAQGATKKSTSIILTANTFYPIRIVHRDGCCGDILVFSWSGPNIEETTDLTEYFYYDR
ncbi:hypothetical protein EBZ38_09395 [bacterium]|nr:hypothetical protein [bacterium]